MKTGFSMFSFSEDARLEEIFPVIKAAGYDGVEPVLSDGGYLRHDSTDQEIMNIRHLAQELGLEIPSVGVWSLWENNLVSEDSTVCRKGMDIVKKQIHCASLMGADTILVVPGYVGCDFAVRQERVRYDKAYERCVKVFRELATFAEQAKVQIGIENVWNRFLLSPLEMRRLLDEVGSEYVNAYFDVGNIMYVGYPEDWIAILAERIKKIHLCDFRRQQAGMGAFVDLFAGDVDFVKVTEALREIGYDDYLILEMLPNYKQFPEMAIWSNKPALDRICRMVSVSFR